MKDTHSRAMTAHCVMQSFVRGTSLLGNQADFAEAKLSLRVVSCNTPFDEAGATVVKKALATGLTRLITAPVRELQTIGC